MEKEGGGTTPLPESAGKMADRSKQFVERHRHIRARGLIASTALGLSDGLITNLAFLTGFAGAISNIDLIRFAGIAAMLAGGVSMLFGAILGARSEHDLFNADSRREAYEIEHEPEEERWELKNLYTRKGLSEEEAESVVRKITSKRQKWLEDMLIHELHLHESNVENPVKIGAVTGASFLLGALVPLTPYLLLSVKNTAVLASVALASAFLFAAGSWKGVIVKRNVLRSGLETLAIGATASAILFGLGSLFEFV